MNARSPIRRIASCCLAILSSWFLSSWCGTTSAAGEDVRFESSAGQVVVHVGDRPVATYVYEDPEISRPYFAHVQAPGGVQVTRTHPPVEGRDATDHATYHPGIWLAFGDISGSDDWRLKAPVRHVRFIAEPEGGAAHGAFAVENAYLAQDAPDRVVCREANRLSWHVHAAGYLLEWDSTFWSDQPFTFGDQEELGIGFRIATPMYVKPKDETLPAGTGRILDAKGRLNEDEVWGNAARWCDYSGKVDGVDAGITIFCHPANFRESWYHARDYGFMAANPFGREAMGQGPKSRVEVQPGQSLRLRYGVLLHSGEPLEAEQLEAAYQDYVRQSSYGVAE